MLFEDRPGNDESGGDGNQPVGHVFGKSPEDRFKLSLLQVEKRFVTLENSVNELNQRIFGKDLSEVRKMDERIDDIEDLLSVEQAAILELKKMLEEMSHGASPVGGQSDGVSVNYEADIDRLGSSLEVLRDEVRQLRAEMQHAITRMQSQGVSKAKSQIESLKKRVSEMEDSMQIVGSSSAAKSVSSKMYENDVNELVSRIVVLESRLAALEKFAQKANALRQQQPVETRRVIEQSGNTRRAIILE